MRFKPCIPRGISIFLCFALPLVGCKRSEHSDSPSSRGGSANYFHTQFQDESQFIVETIITDLAEQVYYAKNHALPSSKTFSVRAMEKANSVFGAPIYDIAVTFGAGDPVLRLELDVNAPIWSPGLYQPVAAGLAKTLGIQAMKANEPEDTTLLANLAEGTSEVIETENQKISSALEGQFTSSVLHENAALLLGAFALRDHSHQFFNLRFPLCRMTSHLAMAQLLQGGTLLGVNGKVAEVILFTMINDQAVALNKLNGIQPSDETLSLWVRVMNARITGDFRPLADIKSRSLIETLTWFQQFSRYANPEVAWNKMAKFKTAYPDVCRIAEDVGYSVETSHELLQLTTPLELKEIASIYERSQGRRLTDLARALNLRPERCISRTSSGQLRISVIGWGQWADFFQRHLCLALIHGFNIYEVKWGLHEDATNFSAHAEQNFGELRLYPFVRRFNCLDADSYRRSTDDGFKVTMESPDLVPADCWNELCYEVPFAEHYQPVPNPHVNEWHKHNPPPGTAYDPHPRLNHPSLISRPDAVTRIAALHALAPYDLEISEYIQQNTYRNHPTREQAASLYGPILAYTPGAATVLARTLEDQPDQYESIMTNAALLDPSLLYFIGDYFLNRKNDDKAAAYFEKGEKLDPDSLRAASYASWRIKYYLKNGHRETARKIANSAGEVYSAVGLSAKGEFHEAVGEYPEAFEAYSNIEERYADSTPLMIFCSRYKSKTGNTRYDAELKQRLALLFPSGIESVTLKSFSGQPEDGVYLSEDSELLRKAGLKQGDVIVAVYGVRTHNTKQYSYARQLKAESELDLIVWQDGKYKEVKANPPNHRFGVSLGDYPLK